ncbi:MAG: GWxTD domain-containing protein [Clostridiales bacterium]|nr:GWxTD domain-containing protein [Clostridiales bacterium]
MKNKVLLVWGAFFAALFLLAPACRLYRLERRLLPEYGEFLSKVRYIITEEERRAFLQLPDSEKPQFIKDFWDRRDPDPYTEINEFKEEYFQRLDSAGKLFPGEGKPGWLTDRGKIYVLFGPPTDRVTTPMSGDAYSRCQEVWYYGDFPVVFLDYYCNGNYTLVSLNLSHLHDLNKAQEAARQTGAQTGPRFDFDLSIKRNPGVESRLEGVVVIEIPYRSIWLSSEGETFQTTLDLSLELRDSRNAIHWEHKSSQDLVLTASELEQRMDEKCVVEIPIMVDKDMASLREGKNRLIVLVKNRTGKEERRKVAEFRLEN